MTHKVTLTGTCEHDRQEPLAITRYIKKWAESAIFQSYSLHISLVSGDRYSLRNAQLFIYRNRYATL